MRPAVRAMPIAPPDGVFGTIAGALSGVLSAPAPIVVPVLVDLFLWYGLRLSPLALTTSLSEFVRGLGTLDRAAFQRLVDGLTAFGDVTPAIAVFAPSLLAGVGDGSVHRTWSRPEYVPSHAGLTLLMLCGLVILSIGISVLFRVWLAGEIRPSSRSLIAVAKEIGAAWGRYLGFLLLVVGAVLAGILPLAALAAIMLVLGLNVGPLLALFVIPPVLLAGLLLAFVPDAIILRRVGPIRGALLSANVVRRHLLPSLGFFAVSALTLSGLSLVLSSFLNNTIGILTAIGSYGFVTTGLARAQLQFFFDRLPAAKAEIQAVAGTDR